MVNFDIKHISQCLTHSTMFIMMLSSGASSQKIFCLGPLMYHCHSFNAQLQILPPHHPQASSKPLSQTSGTHLLMYCVYVFILAFMIGSLSSLTWAITRALNSVLVTSRDTSYPLCPRYCLAHSSYSRQWISGKATMILILVVLYSYSDNILKESLSQLLPQISQ